MERQDLCMVELYMVGTKLCVDYAHNATYGLAERIMLEKVRDFVEQRRAEVSAKIDYEMRKIMEEQK